MSWHWYVLICLDMSWSLIDVWFCIWLDCKVQSLVLCKSLAPFEHRPCSCTAPVSRWFSVTWRWTWEKDGEGTCSKKAAGFQQKVRCGHGASITSSSCFILICFQGLVVTFLRLASVCFTQKVLAKQAFLFLMVGELLVRSLWRQDCLDCRHHDHPHQMACHDDLLK